MEIWWLFPYPVYTTTKRLENGSLVEVFYFPYLRHIIGLMVKAAKAKHMLTQLGDTYISIVTQATQNFTVSPLI